jgi:sterol desaturase/sphingolipid hydroxylase (fatty acid hydroxylase superfamily)
MDNENMHNEIAIRLIFFFSIFVIVALWEVLAARRGLTTSKKVRWISNLGITFMSPLLVRLLFPVLAVNMALKAQERGWGLLNNFDLPDWLEIIAGIVVLDLVIYLQHVMFHAIPILWRLHMVHHADLDYDVTTGLRFHPIEIILSMGIKLSVVFTFGLDRILRYLIVTPDMHRVHHSVIIRETNSNYGFNLPWWDRLFGTYCHQPAKGHPGMTIGLTQFREPGKLTLPWLLILPFIGNPGRYPINRH